MYKYLQEDDGRTQNKKAKCQRACKFCRKSHTTCDDTRPCQRCVKRDIAHLCLQDEAEQLQQQQSQSRGANAAAAAAAATNNASQGSSGDLAPPPSTIPAKRRSVSHSGEQEDERGEDRLMGVFPGFMDGSAGQPVQSIAARRQSMASNISTSPVAQTRASLPPSDNAGSSSSMMPPMGQPGPGPGLSFGDDGSLDNRMQWYDPAFQQAAAGAGQLRSGSVSSVVPVQPVQGHSPAKDTAFTWSALVEGMLNPMGHSGSSRSDPSPGSFTWLTASTGGPSGSASTNGKADSFLNGSSHNKPLDSFAGNMPTPFNPSHSPAEMRHSESSMSPKSTAGLDLANLSPFNWTYAYSRIRTWGNELSDPNLQQRLTTATNSFKAILHTCISGFTDEQIVSAEAQYVQAVHEWNLTCDLIPLAAGVWRRTTELSGANSRLAQLLDVNAKSLQSGKTTLYHIIDPPSFIDYWEAYSAQVLPNMVDRSSFDVAVPVAFLKSGDPRRTHIMYASVQFDSLGLPLVICGIFVPIPVTPNGSPLPPPPLPQPTAVQQMQQVQQVPPVQQFNGTQPNRASELDAQVGKWAASWVRFKAWDEAQVPVAPDLLL